MRTAYVRSAASWRLSGRQLADTGEPCSHSTYRDGTQDAARKAILRPAQSPVRSTDRKYYEDTILRRDKHRSGRAMRLLWRPLSPGGPRRPGAAFGGAGVRDRRPRDGSVSILPPAPSRPPDRRLSELTHVINLIKHRHGLGRRSGAPAARVLTSPPFRVIFGALLWRGLCFCPVRSQIRAQPTAATERA